MVTLLVVFAVLSKRELLLPSLSIFSLIHYFRFDLIQTQTETVAYAYAFSRSLAAASPHRERTFPRYVVVCFTVVVVAAVASFVSRRRIVVVVVVVFRIAHTHTHMHDIKCYIVRIHALDNNN